jgi:hypothetical protein
VTTLVEVTGLVANAAVTPVGRPVAVSVAPPVNPGCEVRVMVSSTDDSSPSVKDEGEAPSVNRGAGVTVRA